LAAFDILTVTGSLYLNHRIMRIYVESVSTNEEWADRLTRYRELGQIAAMVNAPGNDVFDTLDVDAETLRRDSALALYEERLSAARNDLLTNLPEHKARPLLEKLDRVDRAMHDMLAEADLIFRYFRQGETGRAGQRMAGMDRTYARVNGELAGLAQQVAEIQNRQFVDQITAAEHLRKFEYLIGGLIVLMVGGVTFYGHKIVQKVRADELELERYAISLAQARDAATAASKAKSDFLAVMSHEIRNPLTAVLGMADLLAPLELPERARGYVQAIGTSGRHLLAIVNNLLDLSRIEAGALALERIDFPLDGILEQVRSLMAPQAAERGLGLSIEADASAPPVVRGDPTRLTQVLLNLVGNAIKFTPKGGVRVKVTSRPVEEDQSRFRFEVHDNGIGIPPDKQSALFVAFSQVESRTARVYGGTGLGLAISKHLVEAMGGTIGVESAPYRGSVFWFEIPLEVGSREAVVEKVPLGSAPASPLRVLIVEDVRVNRELLGEMLSRQGHEAAFAAHGADAVMLVARERFDVVLMDIQMPVMDGLEATRRIRDLDPPAGDVPVVGLTANVMEEERRRYLEAGMNTCLPKPVAWPNLFAAIAEVTAGRASAAPQASPQGAECSALPLVDTFTVGVAAKAGSEGLLERVIEDAERSCDRLRALASDPRELLQELHKLKGTAGLFGLYRITAAADELRAAARDGGDLAEPIERLTSAVAATRAKLSGTGLVEPEPAQSAAVIEPGREPR
jgi:signal transduction histidine kinase/DNA-binding response OmpR family regulator